MEWRGRPRYEFKSPIREEILRYLHDDARGAILRSCKVSVADLAALNSVKSQNPFNKVS